MNKIKIYQTLSGISFVIKEEIEDLLKNNKNFLIKDKYSEKHKNYGKEFNLYKITKDKNGQVGDFIMKVIPKEEYNKNIKNIIKDTNLYFELNNNSLFIIEQPKINENINLSY